MRKWNFLFMFFLAMMTVASVFAAESGVKVTEAGEAVDVSKITDKYWAQGNDSELGVVQNRKFTSNHKIDLGLFTGIISSDPFLSVHPYGLSLGYHFDQYWSIHAIGWKASVSPSDALRTLQAQTNTNANTNQPKGFYGGEIDANFLYGKVSVLGKMIIYVDLFALGGAGITDTESGKNFTAFVGLGQQIHLNQYLSIRLDYRIMRYNEMIIGKNPSNLGTPLGNRTNTTDVITLGLTFTY